MLCYLSLGLLNVPGGWQNPTGASQIPLVSGTNYNFQVHGIEMVYIPQNSYQLGDPNSSPQATGTTEVSAFYDNNNPGNPYYVSSENVTIPAGGLGANANNLQIPANGSGQSGFPHGYAAFWIMKYELTNDLYVGFLNDLSYLQQYSRFGTPPNITAGSNSFIPQGAANITNLSGMIISTSGTANIIPATVANNANPDKVYNNFDDAQSCATYYLPWADLAAYLDWACLSPMTEMQYEKACRGVESPFVQNEFVWGDQNINSIASTTLLYTGQVNMYSTLSTTTSLGLANYNSGVPMEQEC